MNLVCDQLNTPYWFTSSICLGRTSKTFNTIPRTFTGIWKQTRCGPDNPANYNKKRPASQLASARQSIINGQFSYSRSFLIPHLLMTSWNNKELIVNMQCQYSIIIKKNFIDKFWVLYFSLVEISVAWFAHGCTFCC